MTPGQAAYEAQIAQAVADGLDAGKHAAWDQLDPWQHRRWEAGAAAGAASAHERAAELVTEGNDLRGDFLFERKQVIELRQVLTEMFTCLNTADMSLLDADQVDEWRERAGLEGLT